MMIVNEPKMVVSVLNTCNLNNSGNVLNQSNLESPIHWGQSPETTSPETEQQNCILNFSNHNESFNNNDQSFTSHDRRPSSPVQNGEENSCYDSENGADNLSPPQETSRSSGSEDIGVNLFPISGCNTAQHGFDILNSDNESSQASPSSFHDDDSFHSGKGANSSSNKPKVHKCRNCDFCTTDKYQWWKHLETHMKPEKILRCQKCPFVTEYKHHLDFHIWNHQGMKPYKCDKCAYHCVNKSMLKSHLKSHSNVYQYRCNDCTYRTKYCHSLKIHLRKYKHSPGVVLDPDGNPNPNPVIDVYGNRRGPKQKPKKNDPTTTSAAVSVAAALPLQPSISALSAFPNLSWVNNVFFTDNSRVPCTILPNTAIISTPPFIRETRIPSQESDNLNNNLKMTVDNNNSRANHKSLNNNNNNVNNLNCSTSNINISNKVNNNNSLFLQNNNTDSVSLESVKAQPLSEDEEMAQPETCLEEPPSVSPSKNFFMPYIPEIRTTVEDEAPLNLTVSHIPPVENKVNTQTIRSRRKGKACKLKRIVEEKPDDEIKIECTSIKVVKTEPVEPVMEPEIPVVLDDANEAEQSMNEWIDRFKNKRHYYCEFCEITFFDNVMYTMHMGYHGYKDPYTCNRCGRKSENRIAFYAHMISTAH